MDHNASTPAAAAPQGVKSTRILIVDDDVAICRTLELHLRSQGYTVNLAHSVDEGLMAARAHAPDVAILDIRMPGKSGLEGLLEFKGAFPRLHVIVITAFHDMESAIQAMQRGADDYIRKPIDIDEMDSVVTRILTQHSGREIVDAGGVKSAYNTMVGRSRAMNEVFKTIGRVAASPVTVLITGESGTGKELVARALHRAGKNPSGPFVAVNCAALVETLLESDMFGHEKGAFTGAVSRQPGKFSLASNGTIFLDEVSELSPATQAKLLRVLQEKEFAPLGATQPQHTNARVLAATNVDLGDRVREGRFREDLYYRLRVVEIHLPPLRERKEDVLDLVQALLARINRQMRRNVSQVSTDVITCLQNYDWPGNVRELENILAKAVALCPGNILTPDLIGDICSRPRSSGGQQEPPLAEQSLDDIERTHVLRVLEATHWHRGKACEVLGVSRPRLRRMIRHFGLVPPLGAPEEESSTDDDAGDTGDPDSPSDE